MTGDTHYDLEILAELAEGLLDAGTARQVREHLAVCDPCGERLADLAAVREVLAATPTPAMPMGVALRIDNALAAEAESRRGGIGLVATPDWDELMRDAPWERSVEVPEPARFGRASTDVPETDPADTPEPVRLGVVAGDGTIVPARRRAARRRRWAMPAVAAAAAAVVVVGATVASTGLLTAGDGTAPSGSGGGVEAKSATPPRNSQWAEVQPTRPYVLTDSGHNYSDQDLRQPIEGMFGFVRMMDEGDSSDGQVDKCVSRVASRSKLPTYAVDQGQYNGQEALVIASWKNKADQRLRIDIVDPFNCKNLRKPALGRW
ncbi:zf-HC2 domain-containing protein [Nonomuraea sp. K274]|uniref:Zf-HC2 domain-containing protein n=1 Tax=Nonomuraea cypriaca TaxID=1187855 RepID=A0A931F248_9ACTN|nr:zf-HC2 domain-containing protein [Nonomuraea cypriaca]MBF8188213.1 zf-HC2 domain-containing protein [Nonomuraea cypriaca]